MFQKRAHKISFPFLLHLFKSIACENEISAAVTERKQAELRLKSAQSELKEKEKTCREGETSYNKDKATLQALKKEMTKIEVMVEFRTPL